jgi:hypothetical protein
MLNLWDVGGPKDNPLPLTLSPLGLREQKSQLYTIKEKDGGRR